MRPHALDIIDQIFSHLEAHPQPYMYISGLWFGYPECCCNGFCNTFDGRDFSDDIMFAGTGFIPCPQCQATMTEEQLRTEIERNRLCTQPFPEHDEDDKANSPDLNDVEAWGNMLDRIVSRRVGYDEH